MRIIIWHVLNINLQRSSSSLVVSDLGGIFKMIMCVNSMPDTEKMTAGDCWRDVLSSISFHPAQFPLPSALLIQLAEVLLTKVCKCVNTVAVEMRRWAAACMCACVCVLFFVFSSLPCFLLWLSLTSPPCLRLLQPVMIVGLLAHSALLSFSVWMGEEDKDRVRRQRTVVAGCSAGEGWTLLCTQVGCLWGQGWGQLSQAAVSTCPLLLPSHWVEHCCLVISLCHLSHSDFVSYFNIS